MVDYSALLQAAEAALKFFLTQNDYHKDLGMPTMG